MILPEYLRLAVGTNIDLSSFMMNPTRDIRPVVAFIFAVHSFRESAIKMLLSMKPALT